MSRRALRSAGSSRMSSPASPLLWRAPTPRRPSRRASLPSLGDTAAMPQFSGRRRRGPPRFLGNPLEAARRSGASAPRGSESIARTSEGLGTGPAGGADRVGAPDGTRCLPSLLPLTATVPVVRCPANLSRGHPALWPVCVARPKGGYEPEEARGLVRRSGLGARPSVDAHLRGSHGSRTHGGDRSLCAVADLGGRSHRTGRAYENPERTRSDQTRKAIL